MLTGLERTPSATMGQKRTLVPSKYFHIPARLSASGCKWRIQRCPAVRPWIAVSRSIGKNRFLPTKVPSKKPAVKTHARAKDQTQISISLGKDLLAQIDKHAEADSRTPIELDCAKAHCCGTRSAVACSGGQFNSPVTIVGSTEQCLFS